ncbi:T9SS type A sorting domain-containing protein [bacterium]|nr:T9SS type A sorting domain-containing protein [bacterium]
MRKLFIILHLSFISLLFPWIGLSAAADDYLNYFRTDSAYVYNWNSSAGTWVPVSVQQFQYDNGILLNIYSSDYTTRALQGRSEYAYNSEGLPESVVNYYYSGGWVAASRNLYFYNTLGQVSEIRVQKYSNNSWNDDRIQMNYVYNISGNVTEYQMIYRRNNEWTLPTTDYSYYDEAEKLIRREAIYPSGETDYQILYSYTRFNLLSEMYAQYPGSGGWNNLWKADYQYNPCGLKISQVQYAGSGPDWIPNTKTVSFTYFKPELYPARRVAICHKGETLIVIKFAVQEYLDRGDCIGPCPEIDGSEGNENGDIASMLPEQPFIVYPNPAGEHITVSLRKGQEPDFTRIELLDFRGTVLRTINTFGEEQVTIPRDGLAGGQYFLRVYAGEVYNLLVVFR